MNKEVREDVFRRAENLCECGCGRGITEATGHLDHFWGRAKAPEDVTTCWALHPECDAKKTTNKPTRREWLEKWARHSWKYKHGAQVLAAYDRIAFDLVQGKSK